MEFDLTKEILDQIIFAMEDQTEESVVDLSSGEVIIVRGDGDRYGGERYAPIPDWKPVDGYQLMEHFVTGLRNPTLREELRGALGAGRGVFRSFKDALRRYPEIEKRWYLFKEREMRRVVLEWYNQARELRGLERLSLDPTDEGEGSEDLIEADFVFTSEVGARAGLLAEADKSAFAEAHGRLGAGRVAELYRRRVGKYPEMSGPESAVIVAEDQAGQLAGFVWGAYRPTAHAPGESWKILQLYVLPPYRGIGLASSLLRRFLESTSDRGADAVFVDLGESLLGIGQLFSRHGFAPVSQLMGIDMSAWADRSARSAERVIGHAPGSGAHLAQPPRPE
jgi:GNAT superfamily N-acetyltransferase